MTVLKALSEPRLGIELQFGPLLLAFTDQFNKMFSSAGSSADDVSFWQPIPPDGFFILGGLVYPSLEDPNGRDWALCVKAADPNSDVLRFPDRFEWIWDSVGSRCDDEGSCWKPIPPWGYTALGHMMVQNNPSSIPSGAYNIVCVRDDLLGAGRYDPNRVWTDGGTGAANDMSAWRLIPVPVGDVAEEEGKMRIAANTFLATRDYNPPQQWDPQMVLQLPIPVVAQPAPRIPTLTSRLPPEPEEPRCERVVSVPFTMITDGSRDLHRQVHETPFYDIERWASYDLVLFNDNGTSSSQQTQISVSTGITKEQSSTFSVTTGIEVSYESGINLVAQSKGSVKLSLQFGYSTTKSVSEFRSETVTATLDTPAGKAAAVWSAHDHYKIKRRDGSYLTAELTFDDSARFVHAEFPHADDMPKGRRFVSFPAAK